MSARVCPAPRCLEVIPMGLIMCTEHWGLVPADLRRKIYALYHRLRRGDTTAGELFREALEQAVDHVTSSTRRAHG